MIKINLVPADILAKAAQRQQNIQIGMVGSAVAVFVLAISAMHYHKSVRLKKDLDKYKAELARLEEIVKKVAEAEAKAAALRTRLKAIDDLSRERPRYPYFMSDFTKTVPTGIWVKTLKTSLASKVLSLQISAEAAVSEDIALWFANMEKDGKFSGVELTGQVVVGADSALAFSAKATYTPAF